VTAYDPNEWHDLFVAVASASAALAGLVFVAVSINIERIIKYPGLPERALETLLFLVVVLLVSIVGLIPGQGHVALGVELLVLSLGIGAGVTRLRTIQVDSGEAPVSWTVSRWTVRTFAFVPLIVGGASVLVEAGGGLYWIVGGIVFAVGGAVASAWVLLVEILR
jgi:modulator of FtsH protease